MHACMHARMHARSHAHMHVIIVTQIRHLQVPIILIGFASLGGVYVPPQVSAWIAVFILPLNSAVNPLIYTISAINFAGINLFWMAGYVCLQMFDCYNNVSYGILVF